MLTADLIHKAAKKDKRAEKEIFRLSYPFVRTCCIRYLKNEQEADEAVMNVYLIFFTALIKFDYQNEKATFGFLKKIAVNECLMQLRKSTSFSISTLSDGYKPEVENEALSDLATTEIFKLVMELPVGYRTVFNLYEVEGYAHAEIAAMLGITAGTSKSQLSKARQMLQKKIISKETYHAKLK